MPKAKAKKPEKKLSLRYPKNNPWFFVVILLIFGIAGYFLLGGHAAPTAPNVYLSPVGSTTVGANSTFTVQVRENSGTTDVNAVQANFSYPTSLVSFVSISSAGTAFPTGDSLSSGATAGQVSIVGGVSTSTGSAVPVTGDQLVAIITFKSLSSGGSAAMAFTSGTLLVNSSTNTDILGGLSNTTGLTHTVDTTPPTVTVTSPTNGASLNGGSTVTVTATATDTQTISSVSFYIDGTLASTVTTSPYTYSWNTSGVALGSHTIQAKATDALGIVGSSSVNTVTLSDLTPPTTPGSFSTTGHTTTSISLSWTASTDSAGVTGYRLSRNGTTVTTTSGTALSYTDSGLTPGTSYSYSLVAIDTPGNVSSAATLSPSTCGLILGDINGDCTVNINDLSLFINAYGSTASSSNWNAAADLNKDGSINILDLSIFLNNYGKSD